MRLSPAIHLFFLALFASVGISSGQTSIVNGASFNPTSPMAPGSFATIFGQNLCGQTAAAQLDSHGMYPTMLKGCSVTINGIGAMMQYVAAGQMNIVVPQNVGSGIATVVIQTGSQPLTGSMLIGPAGPGVFSQDGMGMGNGSMLLGTNWQMGPFSITTHGQATPVSIFMTGLDLSVKPVVMAGGVPVDVTFYGSAPGYPGLQQINMTLGPNMAGAGRVPVTVTSNGQTSNVTFMTLLPTTQMMQGMPGWGSGMMVADDMPRGAEMSYLAVNPTNNTALVTDEAGDALRVISLTSKTTLAAIALPAGSRAGAVAINSGGTLAAVALTEKGSVALIDLIQNQVTSVIWTGYYACRLAFAGANLLVTGGASGTVAVIDTNARQVARTVNVGFGPSGIAAAGNIAVVANMQAGSLSIIHLTDYSVTPVSLPPGSRPHEVAISEASNKAIITTPMSNSALLLRLDTLEIQQVDLTAWSGIGPGGVVTNGALGFIGDQMAANVAVVDLNAGKVVKTFPVDPGPRSLAVNPANNQLLVLCQGTGTLDLVDLNTYAVTGRINATSGNPSGHWALATITSVTPKSARIGDSFTLTINGSNLNGVADIEFQFAGTGMMGGGMNSNDDPNIKVTSLMVNSAATQITALVQILAAATPGARQIRIGTGHGDMMGSMNSTLFTVTQ